MVNKNILYPCLTLLAFTSFSFSTIVITQPAATNFEKNELPYMYANFGVIHYNKPMSYELFLTDSTLCEEEPATKI